MLNHKGHEGMNHKGHKGIRVNFQPQPKKTIELLFLKIRVIREIRGKFLF